MFGSKSHFSHLLVLACIATNAHAAPACTQQGWEVLGDRNENRTVCDVAELLLASHCPTNKGFHHLPSTKGWYRASNSSFEFVRDCACTSTIWNLLTACAACQRWPLEDAQDLGQGDWQSLDTYENNACSEAQSPPQSGGGLQIQPDNSTQEWTTMAPWAAEVKGSSFNLKEALAKVDPNQISPTGPAASPTNTANIIPASASPVDNATNNKSGPNIGAIVGGVVGGLAFLGAIFALLLFLHRRKRHARDVAPSSEFLKPEYYSSPPLLPANRQRDSEYRDDIEEEAAPPSASRTLSWVGGMVATRRHEADGDEILPPFTQGTYIGPSPHEKGHPERRHTDESDATATSNTHLLSSSSRPGTSE